MIAITSTSLALVWPAAVLLLVSFSAADALREMFPPRRDLLSRLALVRLYQMLGRRSITVPEYLQATSRRQIASQIRTCESCASRAQCDSALRSSGPADFGFCPSDEVLSALSR